MTKKLVKPVNGGATFSISHRTYRFVWNFVWRCFGIWTPVPFYGWRRFLIVSFGGRMDKTSRVYPGVRIWFPKNLIMERDACLGPGVDCYCMGVIHLENEALVSQRATLCSGTHDIDDPDFPLVVKSITLKRRSWVASEAFVGPGVTLGEGAVLGARSVAFKSLEGASVYVGNPATLVRMRNC